MTFLRFHQTGSKAQGHKASGSWTGFRCTRRVRDLLRSPVLLAPLAFMAGCSATGQPIPTVSHVELSRFMGDWYVIANIPTFIEKGAHNAKESYALNSDGSIATTFTFNDGGFEGKGKRYQPTGFIKDAHTNAEWGMQFVWPFKAEYRIVHLAPDYSQTIIGRSPRDYLWIMARTPQISAAELDGLIGKAAALGYDTRKIQRVPQQPPAISQNKDNH